LLFDDHAPLAVLDRPHRGIAADLAPRDPPERF
jgi:hypothetical protein